MSNYVIAKAGEKVLVLLYNGKPYDGLNNLRYKKFCEKAAISTMHVKAQCLPPTSLAAKYHSYHVYHQIQHWVGTAKPPLEWSWRYDGSEYSPEMTDIPPTPEELLKVIQCNCKADCSSG